MTICFFCGYRDIVFQFSYFILLFNVSLYSKKDCLSNYSDSVDPDCFSFPPKLIVIYTKINCDIIYLLYIVHSYLKQQINAV